MANKTTSPGHAHPHEAVPVRIAKESGFAAPGLDVPAEQSRPARDAGTERDHPANRPLQDEDKSLIGPELGRGGTEKPMAPLQPTDVYCDPTGTGDADEKFVPGVGPALAGAPQFVDVSSLIGKTRGS